jgi:hypothetical protein
MIYKILVHVNTMEEACIEVLNILADSRRNFFRRVQTFRRHQEEIALNFISAERDYLTVIRTIMETRSQPISISIPMFLPGGQVGLPSGFMDPVPVLPTEQQITNELVELVATTQVACAICQEQISADGCQLRGCHHAYHRNCIRTWFGASSLCPVCRRDVRGDQEGSASSASSETYPQDMFQ